MHYHWPLCPSAVTNQDVYEVKYSGEVCHRIGVPLGSVYSYENTYTLILNSSLLQTLSDGDECNLVCDI